MREFELPLVAGVVDQEILRAHADLELAMQRVKHLPLEQQQAQFIGEVLRLISRTHPSLKQSDVSTGLYSIAEEMLSRAPVDIFGGRDAEPTDELITVLLSVAAHALSERTGITITKARKRIAGWSGGVVNSQKLRRWGYPGGEQMRDQRVSSFEKMYEDAAAALEGMPDDRIEDAVKQTVRRLVARIQKRPRFRK